MNQTQASNIATVIILSHIMACHVAQEAPTFLRPTSSKVQNITDRAMDMARASQKAHKVGRLQGVRYPHNHTVLAPISVKRTMFPNNSNRSNFAAFFRAPHSNLGQICIFAKHVMGLNCKFLASSRLHKSLFPVQ